MDRIALILFTIIGCTLVATVAYAIASVERGTPATYGEKLPVLDAQYDNITIQDYSKATDQNWTTVLNFLENDSTYKILYSYPNFTCGNFAQKVHDDAEAQGIRCGLVAISFTNVATPGWDVPDGPFGLPFVRTIGTDNAGHAVVVFNTTDRGPVYVDETNDGVNGSIKIGYLQPGQEYDSLPLSLVDFNRSDCFDYAYYQSIEKRYQEFLLEVENYYRELNWYNREVRMYNYYGDATGLSYDSLQSEGKTLDQEKAYLESCEELHWQMYNPMGYVSQITTYW